MTLMGGGMMTPLGGGRELQLVSSADTFIVKDQDGAPLFKVDSKGNVYWRGKMRRI